MKEFSELMVIDKDDAEILFRALQPYFMEKVKIMSKNKQAAFEVKVIKKLYDELKTFRNQE